mgnify:CR=1 FL=1
MCNVPKIKELAKQKGIKLSFICEQLGVAKTYLNTVAAGKARLNDEKLSKIAEILGTTVSYLCDEDEVCNKERVCNIDRMNALIKSKGIKKSYICEQLGLQRSYLSHVESGLSSISEERLEKIADILGTTVAYLCDETDDPEPPEDDELYNEICARIKELDPSERQWLIDTIDRIAGKK